MSKEALPMGLLLLLPLVVLPGPAFAKPGDDAGGVVTLPLPYWDQMQAELARAREPEPPPFLTTTLERKVDGAFSKGLLSATLQHTFDVAEADGHVRVPILDGTASLGEVLLDGKPTSLLRDETTSPPMYTVGIDKKGPHTVRVRFFWGEEQDRFTRRLHFALPPGGITAVTLVLPEPGIEAKLAGGAITRTEGVGGGTRLTGYLDANGQFDLSWTRRLGHQQKAARYDARQNTLFMLGEALVRGVSAFELEILEGEADRFDLRLPEGVEVLRVEGDAVLQWHTDNGDRHATTGEGRLVVLLRYLVEDQARFTVHFQLPLSSVEGSDPKNANPPKTALLLLPSAAAEANQTGNFGVQSPPGFNVVVKSAEGAQALEQRDWPPELVELCENPLLLAYSFSAPPKVELLISRHAEVEQKTAVIDDLQASTVVIEDGTEVTKLKLRVRNNSKQKLAVALPEGARLTHSLIDGQPVRPGRRDPNASMHDSPLLLPLRQSERLGAGGMHRHIVREGETLSDIANAYYSNPNGWQRILQQNQDTVFDVQNVSPGTPLDIPLEAQVEESSFIIELAYETKAAPLGFVGRRDLLLPKLDLEASSVTWHLYLQDAHVPLRFSSNLNQYSAIRYDPVRRARGFLGLVFSVKHAWAGDKYRSIFAQRKELYIQENERKQSQGAVLASFPLVGERYRFKRQLLGDEQPSLSVYYCARGLYTALRYIALFGAFAATFWLVLALRDKRRWLIAAATLLLLLLLAHYVLGVHRRILWGVDLALLLHLGLAQGRATWRWLYERYRAPWSLFGLIHWRNLFFLVGVGVLIEVVSLVPLLFSSLLFCLLAFAELRLARRAEVHHA